MLNDMIGLMQEKQVFDLLGKDKARAFVLDMVALARKSYECSEGEILEGHEAALGICPGCLSATDDIDCGMCGECRAAYPEDYEAAKQRQGLE